MKAIESYNGQPQRPEGSRDTWERGQALVIVVFAVFGLLVLVGLAVDLGLYYIERVRIVRAVDSATLAAAYELPLEEAARVQAIDYLQQNGYDVMDPDTALVIDGVMVSPPTSGVTKTVIYLDTAQFQDPPGSLDTAYKIEIRIRRSVPLIFMRFAGFEDVFTEASAVAENINNLDVVIVFDKSGSMEFDTLCYGCWVGDGGDYPSGDLYPLPWEGAANGTPQHCSAGQRYTSDGHDYYFIEAEEYTYTTNPYNRDLYSVGYTYWVLERTTTSASSRDDQGAYIMHMPYPDMELGSGAGVTCRYDEVAADSDPADGQADGKCWSGAPGGPYLAPRVDYNFTPLENRSGGYYIWVRGQSPGTWVRNDRQDTSIFWGIDGVLGGAQYRSGNCGVGCEQNFPRGTGYDGARGDRWEWRRLNRDGPLYLSQGVNYMLNIWAGGAEFALDRIVITSNPNGYSDLGPLHENGGKGRAVWANGRSGWVCNTCDARFGGYPSDHADRPDEFNPIDYVSYYPACDTGPVTSQDRRNDFIYDDEQPMRDSVEAAKMFVRELLDPEVDQVGYVRYSSDSEIASELQCLRRLGGEACTEDVIEATVIDGLNSTRAGGNTDIGGGMLNGLDVLSTRSGHYGRPGATHVMIVMTDGVANVTPNRECYRDPDRQWLEGEGSTAQDCVIYYAHEARNNNVIVYTITLGVSADFELMQAVADLTGGVHRNADRPEKLTAIFEELYELMYLRLVK
jgi:hypothetical protein